jgi:2-amino-4-hydroxy-6-hydroxymethyldihydropteridine diphosphokinase
MTSAAPVPVRVYLGFGSNLDGPERQVRAAVAEVGALSGTTLHVCSSLYRTAPLGPADQPAYINAVACFETTLAPHDLLDALNRLEAAHGRVRGGERWGARPLDIDILLYGERTIADARLTVPHAGLAAREFVLIPLCEIAPELDVPGLGRVRELAARFAPDSVIRL